MFRWIRVKLTPIDVNGNADGDGDVDAGDDNYCPHLLSHQILMIVQNLMLKNGVIFPIFKYRYKYKITPFYNGRFFKKYYRSQKIQLIELKLQPLLLLVTIKFEDARLDKKILYNILSL